MVLPVFTSYPLGEGTKKIRNYPSPAAIFPVGSCGRGVSSPRRSVAAGGIFGEPFHFTAESATFVVHGKAGIQLARSSGFAAGSQTALARRIASLLRRAAALYHRTVRGQPRPSGVEPRCGGACCGDPLRFDTPDDRLVGRRPSGLCAQDRHGAPRGVPHQPQAGGASAAFRASPRAPTTLSEGAIRRSRSRPLSVWPRPPSCAARSGR